VTVPGSPVVSKKGRLQVLKKEEKWWHFSNEDILAALQEEEEHLQERNQYVSPAIFSITRHSSLATEPPLAIHHHR
jgi:hypothetical protein